MRVRSSLLPPHARTRPDSPLAVALRTAAAGLIGLDPPEQLYAMLQEPQSSDLHAFQT